MKVCSRKKLLALALCAVLCLGALTGCSGSRDLKIGSAGIGGTYHAFATVFASILTDDDENLKVEVLTTAGSAENLKLLSKGEIQLALAQADLADAAFNGTGTEKLSGFSAIASLYTEACQIVVRADSGIAAVPDLAGKKVSIGEEGSGTEQNAKQILEAYGVSGADVLNYDYTTASQKLTSGEIDAFFCTIGAPNTVVEETAKNVGIQLLPIDGAAADKLITADPFYIKTTIPAGTYGLTEAVETLGVRALLLASDKLSKVQAQTVASTLFEHTADLHLTLPIDFVLNEDLATAGITIPFHEGAKAYYQSKGLPQFKD
ncbi:MAG: TAXI family TRAP transporter solute-binding subunit [Lachnospiraceae bacterium]|nr:TAXI family TRAP transporter solute-binding subunit [Lachnospiraceae bacterium]